MAEDLGGNINFPMSRSEVPLTYPAAELFNKSDERMGKNGGGLPGFIEVTQDNFAELLRTIANLEYELRKLQGK